MTAGKLNLFSMDSMFQGFMYDPSPAGAQSSLPLVSSKMLEKIFMEIPAMLCVLTGAEFSIAVANEPFLKLLGHKNIFGKKLIDVLPELKGQGFMEILQRVYETGESYTGKEMPVRLNRGSGRSDTVYLNFNYQTFIDEEVKMKGILVFAYDVSEHVLQRQQTDAVRNRFRHLVEGLPAALYTTDAAGRLTLYNDAAVDLWGERPVDDEIPAVKFYDKDGKPLTYDESPMGIALHSGIIRNIEIILERKDGIRHQVVTYPQVEYDDNANILRTVNVLIDITEQVNARRELENIGEMIHNLYMNAPAFICTLAGEDHVFELVNPEYQKLYGKRQLVGRKIIEALPELVGQGILEKLDMVYQTGTTLVVTERLVYIARDEHLAPEPTYLNFSYQPMKGRDDEIYGILVFGYEVTGQVLARNKGEENLRLVLESLPQITSTSSADGTNIYFNKYFFEYSGISREDANKNGWNAILHPEEIQDILDEWDDCKKQGKDFYKEIRLRRHSDGMYRWHIAHLTPIKDSRNEVTQWVATATDIHEQKTKEQKKDEFISIASHELKTPLTTVKAYLQLLEISLENAPDNVQLYTKKAILSVDRLKDLITELLDANKIQHGLLHLHVSSFDFEAMLQNAVETIQSNTTQHRIITSFNVPGNIEGDEERLQQVVFNLLSNAIKYSPESEEVYINATRENGWVTVAVRDTGIGIDHRNLEKIFERYFRVAGHDIRFQGLGIGLYISMSLIEQHHGRIWAESKLNEGSTFYFTIPEKQNQYQAEE